MNQSELLQRIWSENEFAVLERSRAHYDSMSRLIAENKPELAFVHLARIFRQPVANWQDAVLHLWEQLETDFPNDYPELEKMLGSVKSNRDLTGKRIEVQLWLWRRVVKSGNQALIRSRFFADDFLFHRSLREDKLILWYGARRTEWPIQLLLGLFLGSRQATKRLRVQLYWPAAKLPDDFDATREENRILRRLWEARILVRFGTWVHLHPQIMLYLPEISSYSSPVLKWEDNELLAHMQDGRIWVIEPFALAALIFDESLALYERNRQGLWTSFLNYATKYLRYPDDVASRFVQTFFEEIGMGAMTDARQAYLTEFAESILFFETLRASI